MREDEFRERLRGALGEPPPMPGPALRPSTTPARLYPRVMGLVAFATAILLVVVLISSRLALRPRADLLPAATPNSRITQPAPDSFPCYLPVNMVQEAGNPGQTSAFNSTMGFINIPAGAFAADTKATVNDLPGGGGQSPRTYSAALHRWLPAMTMDLSPDGLSYAYVKPGPTGAELHVVDVRTHADRMLWTTSDGADIKGWNSAGILVFTVPLQGGIAHYWRIDQSTGAAAAAPSSDDPTRLSPALAASLGTSLRSISYLGGDGSGRAVFRLGSRDPGTAYTVVLVESGAESRIYSGKAGDAMDFDPEGVYFDAHGVWLGNFDGTRVWLWSQAQGLHDYKVTGAPAAPAGYQYFNLTFLPAGPCIPGTYAGPGA